MAYQAHRKSKYTQEFELVNEEGIVEHKILVALDPGSCIEKMNKKYIDLLKADKEVNKMKLPDASLNHEELLNAYQKLGIAVDDLIEAVFGTEDTKTILEFYRNDYAAMSAEVIPFITTVVLPDLRKITQDNKRDILSKYNRKQRRSIKRMMKK